MGVRQRRDGDVEALTGILRRVASEGYPPHRPGGAEAFVGAGNELASRRRPVLDVWERLPAAIALYESAGWEKVAAVDIRFRSPCSEACVHDGNGIRSFVFVGPHKRPT